MSDNMFTLLDNALLVILILGVLYIINKKGDK
nr:MAG TPA: hypothetical protein [Caudoviricetes sp.]